MEENNNNEKFVPAYSREKNVNDNNNINKNSYNNNKKEKKFKSKITKILILIILIAIILGIVFGVYKLFFDKSEEININYLEDMQDYGFDLMYDNESASQKETVTKSEALKMVISSMLNESDITRIINVSEYILDYNDTMTKEQIEEKLEYKNQLWVEYAIKNNIIFEGDITKDNANEKATFLNVLVYFANAKSNLLNEILDTENTPKIKNFELYKPSERLAISDMIYNGIIEEKASIFDDVLTKKDLNKLVIDMVLKYNTITIGEEKININKDKEPSNVDEYPYTLASVDKSIYEIENYKKNNTRKNARNSYIELKSYYETINTLVNDYMNTILNIDYTYINEDTFVTNISDYSFYYEDEVNIKEYLKYVKTNQIKMSGNTKLIFPAIYYDGEDYRVRVKVDYKIENAVTKENLIYGDFKSKDKVVYDKLENSMIIDMPINKAVLSDIIYVKVRPISNMIAGKVKSDNETLKKEFLPEIMEDDQI